MRPNKYRKTKTSKFIEKLHAILQDQTIQDTVRWTEDNNGFVIKNMRKFTDHVLPKYFKHCNYYSFVRQLNMYDFCKIRDCGGQGQNGEEHGYANKLFVRGEQEQYGRIRRKETVKVRDVVAYGNFNGQEFLESSLQNKQKSLFERLKDVKEKQQKLQQICYKLISQNQLLLNQNQELAHRIKKQSRKKQKILEQVFRIIGVSIAEFWDEFCEDTETIQQKTNNFKKIYQLLMVFIDKNDLSEIMKTLGYFITPKVNAKIFKVVDAQEQVNFLSHYSQQQIEQFINETNFILETAFKPNY